MKKIIKVMTLLAFMSFTSYQVLAQPAPGEQSGSAPVAGGPIGGGAPIGNGLIILVAMGVAYGISKLNKTHHLI